MHTSNTQFIITLDTLCPEIQTEIILYVENPGHLGQCSRSWYNMVNSPAIKSKWLISRVGRTHALFHAVRMGEPFINLDVVKCLFAQKAQLSRYFLQKLREKREAPGRGIPTRWASDLPPSIVVELYDEGQRQFGKGLQLRGNDAQHFYTLSGASQNTTEAKPIIQHNASGIIKLIKVYKFVPLPCVRRKTVLRFSDTVGCSCDHVKEWKIVARAIAIYPELVNVWKKNGGYDVMDDLNVYERS
ncbi:7379_t:CDS:1 [Paraglomus brasilianum]|uniref:7379_t:CDS:1 n=1 Tax=Paraglomus brasilianum TaxID=144538 RepID=A0A9N9BZA8_9GLOM|nr:7379_t:CDS:1 [Paraglomus brasilianum]